MSGSVYNGLNDGRRNQPREQLMVSEYLAANYSVSQFSTRVRLGSASALFGLGGSDEAGLDFLRAYGRWADAIVFEDRKTTIIEAKILPKMGPLEALLVYRNIFKSDPKYSDRAKLPIELVYLYAIEDPTMVRLARELGIRAVMYEPAWLEDYKNLLRARDLRGPLVAPK